MSGILRMIRAAFRKLLEEKSGVVFGQPLTPSDPGDRAVSSGAKQLSNEQTESVQISNSSGGIGA